MALDGQAALLAAIQAKARAMPNMPENDPSKVSPIDSPQLENEEFNPNRPSGLDDLLDALKLMGR